jgi:hypothetical protein
MSGRPAREDGLLAGLRIIAEFNAATERLRSDLGVPAGALPLIEPGLLALAVGTARRDYFAEHGDDMVPVKLIDLMCAVARMRQVRDHGIDAEPIVLDRIFMCDLPRLEGYLPERAREEMER